MFSCPVCECDEYDEVDGMYYCKTCCTLSQEYHVQEVEDVNAILTNNFSGLRRLRKARKKGPSRALGRPWSIYEAYQCIILAQCDALIALGAKEDLRDIVYTIWANYLSKLKVAFCKNEQVVAGVVFQTGHGRHRELHGGTLEKPWNKKKPGMKEGRKRDLFSSSSESESEAFIYENKGNTGMVCKAVKSAEWMDLKKTVAFCYIGLQYTNPEILLVQLLRWIYEGKVPFMSTTHLLNDDMVLSGDDHYLFQPVTITVQKTITEMNKISSYMMLGVPTPSVEMMIHELVHRLHLPHELKAICTRLYNEVPIKRSRSSHHYYISVDFHAIQYIALALKLIFGLDDRTEHQLSEYSQEAQKLIGPGENVFVWNEWRSYQMEKEKDLDLYRESKGQVITQYKYQHLDQLLENFHNLRREDRHITVKLYCRNDEHHESLVKGLKNPLQRALSGSQTTCKAPCDTSDTEEALKRNFTDSTLTHIVDFKVFKTRYKGTVDKCALKNLKKHRKSVCKNLVYTRYGFDDEQTFYGSRPNSYLWLLEFLSNFIDYNTVRLDINLTKLETLLKEKL